LGSQRARGAERRRVTIETVGLEIISAVFPRRRPFEPTCLHHGGAALADFRIKKRRDKGGVAWPEGRSRGREAFRRNGRAGRAASEGDGLVVGTSSTWSTWEPIRNGTPAASPCAGEKRRPPGYDLIVKARLHVIEPGGGNHFEDLSGVPRADP